MEIEKMIDNMKLNGVSLKSEMRRSLKRYSNFSKEEINNALALEFKA